MVYEAVLKGKRIKAGYRKLDSGMSEEFQELHPLGLVFVDNLIYLIAPVNDDFNPRQFLRQGTVSLKDYDEERVLLEAEVLVNLSGRTRYSGA